MVSTETINSILALDIPDSQKAELIAKLAASPSVEPAAQPTAEPSVERIEDPKKDFIEKKFEVFDTTFVIYGREENIHKAPDAKYMYWIRVYRKGHKGYGKAIYFDETDQFGKKGWLFFDPKTNERITDKKSWGRFYSRATDCCRFLFGNWNTEATLEDVISGKCTSQSDFAVVREESIDSKTLGDLPFEDVLPFN